MLEVNQVRQSFRSGFWLDRVEVLKAVSFNVRRNSVFGFLGPNGAGKTTLIHLIVGMKRPREGSVKWCGVDTSEGQTRSKIGYLPERPYFHDFLTGKELLLYFGRLSGLKRATALARIDRVLTDVGMAHAKDLELKKYSKGMLQRIGVAQAILHDPEFLVLDEPMSGLDPVGRNEMRELIIQLAAEGRTIFFSSHVIPDVEALCDEIAILKKGVLIESGTIEQFLEQGTTDIELRFSNVDPSDIFGQDPAVQIRKKADVIYATFSKESDIQLILKKVIDRKGVIHGLNPIRTSLEEKFKSE